MKPTKTLPSLEQARIGVDIGRVLMCPTDEIKGPDTSFLTAQPELAMKIPPSTGAEPTLRALVAATGGNVWYVSKAGKRVQALTRQWFRHNDFHRRVGTEDNHLRFCFKRHEKHAIAKQLLLTHFIDDRRDVLEHLRGLVPNLYLFGVQADPAPGWATHVRDWSELCERLLGRARSDASPSGGAWHDARELG